VVVFALFITDHNAYVMQAIINLNINNIGGVLYHGLDAAGDGTGAEMSTTISVGFQRHPGLTALSDASNEAA